MGSSINIGLRHILPVYPLLAITAGAGVANLLQNRIFFPRIAAVLLLVAQVLISAAVFPDYLAYFNLLAGNPERMLADSNLDWGQDVARLALELRARGIRHMTLDIYGTADLSQHGIPTHLPLKPHRPASGWIAISLTQLSLGTSAPPFDGYRWLEDFEPVTTIGKTVRLYYIEAGTITRDGLALPAQWSESVLER
jgi:hypothetical protein